MKTKLKMTSKRASLPAATELSLARTETHNAEIVEDDKLTPSEEAALRKQEGIIRAKKLAFLDTAEALFIIKRDRLYRATHATFTLYAGEVWGFARDWARRLVDSHETAQADLEAQNLIRAKSTAAGALPGMASGTPSEAWLTSKHTKETDGLAREVKVQVLAKARELAGGKDPTPAQIRECAAPFRKPKKPRKPKAATKPKDAAAAKPGPKATHPDKAAAERLTEIAKELEKLPRGGLAALARREKLEAEQAELEARLQGKAAEKERAKANGNGSAKKSVLLTAHEVKARIAAWLKSELTTEQRNKSQPVWKTAERIKDLF